MADHDTADQSTQTDAPDADANKNLASEQSSDQSTSEPNEDDLPEAEIVEEAPLDPLAQAESERDDYLDKWKRAQADFQNLRRRTLADMTLSVQRGTGDILTEVLGVLEFLDMALKSPCESADAKALLVGVQMTRDQLWKVLEAKGVSIIPTDGDFDPDNHQAVATVESEPAGQIIDVVRDGYRRPTDVLRHAQVRVSVAPSPPSETDESGDQGADEN